MNGTNQVVTSRPITERNIEITLAAITEKPILRHLLELYQYDFSEFDGADLEPYGTFGYPYLDHYWVEPGRHPFIVRVDGNLAGFALVAQHDYLGGEKDCWVMAEFFILRKYRHQGLGEHVAHDIFDQFPGTWQVNQVNENQAAIAFWRKVIDRYTQGNYEEFVLQNSDWHGPVQVFVSHTTGLLHGINNNE